MKIYLYGVGYMTKMAAMSIYGKNPLKILTGTSGSVLTKLGIKHPRLKPILVCSNDNPGLTSTFFTAWANFAN